MLRSLVQYARDYLKLIAAQANATGNVAETVDATEIPTTQASGSPPPEPEAYESMTETPEVAQTREALHEALQNHLCALYDHPMVTTNWMIVSENVGQDGNRVLYPAMSADMTAWSLLGMSVLGFRYFAGISQSAP